MKEKLSFLMLGVLVGMLATTFIVGFNAVFGGTSQNSKKVLKLAHGLDASHPVHKAMLYMKDEVEKMSSGKLSLDIYSGGVLGSEPQCIEQLNNGSLDMTKASTAQLGTFVPRMYLLTLAYLYRDSNHYWNVLNSNIGKSFFSYLKNAGFIGLCYYDAGSRCFYTSKKKISSSEDLKGMKIRVMNSRTDMEMVSCFGASPTPISSGETYTALAQGLVDGAENNLPTYLTSAHYEICKYFIFDEHTRIPDVLIISEKTWSTLSEKEREILKKASEKSSRFQRELWAKSEKEAVDILKEKGVEFINVDKSNFRKITEKIFSKYTGEDAEIIKQIINTK